MGKRRGEKKKFGVGVAWRRRGGAKDLRGMAQKIGVPMPSWGGDHYILRNVERNWCGGKAGETIRSGFSARGEVVAYPSMIQ